MNPTTRKISEELNSIANRLLVDMEEVTGEQLHFTLLVYTEERTQYVSNVSREDSIDQIEFYLKMLKAGMEPIPLHKLN